MCDCELIADDVKALKKTVKELTDTFGVSSSNHFNALAELSSRIKAVEDILAANREVDKVMNDIHAGSAALAKIIIATAKVVGALTIIFSGIGAWLYAISHWKPH